MSRATRRPWFDLALRGAAAVLIALIAFVAIREATGSERNRVDPARIELRVDPRGVQAASAMSLWYTRGRTIPVEARVLDRTEARLVLEGSGQTGFSDTWLTIELARDGDAIRLASVRVRCNADFMPETWFPCVRGGWLSVPAVSWSALESGVVRFDLVVASEGQLAREGIHDETWSLNGEWDLAPILARAQ